MGVKSTNTHIWQQHGLLPSGEKLVDTVMPYLLEVVKSLPPDLARIALEEAIFQVHELPKRSEEFRKKMTWKR